MNVNRVWKITTAKFPKRRNRFPHSERNRRYQFTAAPAPAAPNLPRKRMALRRQRRKICQAPMRGRQSPRKPNNQLRRSCLWLFYCVHCHRSRIYHHCRWLLRPLSSQHLLWHLILKSYAVVIHLQPWHYCFHDKVWPKYLLWGSSSPFTSTTRVIHHWISEYLLCRSLLSFYSSNITPLSPHWMWHTSKSLPFWSLARMLLRCGTAQTIRHCSLSYHHYNKFLKFPQSRWNYLKTEWVTRKSSLSDVLYVWYLKHYSLGQAQVPKDPFTYKISQWLSAFIWGCGDQHGSQILALQYGRHHQPYESSFFGFFGSCFHIEDYHRTLPILN
jgi:hypothetical protein